MEALDENEDEVGEEDMQNLNIEGKFEFFFLICDGGI